MGMSIEELVKDYCQEHGQVIIDKYVWIDIKGELEIRKALYTHPQEVAKNSYREAMNDAKDCIDKYSVAETYYGTLETTHREAKKGHWIKEDRGHVEYSAVCSECGDSTFWSEKSNFCPNCGADMRKVEE